MDQINQQVARARKRLNLDRFLQIASWSLFWCLLIGALAYGVRVYWGGGTSTEMPYFAGGALAGGLLVATLVTYFGRRLSMDAALEIDRRFNLKERISSSLSLSPEELESEAGQALLDDAVRRVERIEVAEEFKVRTGAQLALPLLAAAIFALTTFIPNPINQANEAAAKEKELTEQLRKPAKELKKKIEKREKQLAEKGLKDASELLKKVSDDLDRVTNDDVQKKEALVKMNDIAKEIANRRKSLGGAADIKKKLEDLKNIKSGPADKMFKAMEEGDLNAAMDQMQDLKNKLADGDLSEEDMKKLAEQLEQMREKLEKMNREREQQMSDLQEQIDQRKRAGDTEGAEQLQQQLDGLREQQSSMDQMMQMADQLGKAAENLKSGESDLAMESLDELMDQLDAMQQALDELETLDGLMDELDGAKQMMSGQFGNGQSQMSGQGLGDGQGDGERPRRGIRHRRL